MWACACGYEVMTKDGVVVENAPRTKSRLRGAVGGLCQFERDRLNASELAEIQSDLAIWHRKEEKAIRCYWETERFLLTPRDYGVQRFGLSSFMNNMSDGSHVDFKFVKELKPEQVPLVNAVIGTVTPGHGGVLDAACGTGKTVMALYLIAHWGKTATILVHNEALADQWAERAAEFLGLEPKEIGRVQQDKCEFKGKKLVICVIESAAFAVHSKRTDYPEEFYNWAGVTVYDEVHRHAATTWHKAVARFPASIRLGLSATPERPDGMEQIIYNHIGPIVARSEVHAVEPKVFMIEHETKVSKARYHKWRGGQLTDEVNPSKLINLLAKNDARNAMLAEYVADALETDRKIMVLSDRLDQLREIKKLAATKLATSVGGTIVEGADERIYVKLKKRTWSLDKYVGGMVKERREEAARANSIFGTYAIASEGLDIPALDTLVMATPRTNVEQSVGRILRVWTGKAKPYVVDIVDIGVEFCEHLANKRLEFYEDRDWPVKVL